MWLPDMDPLLSSSGAVIIRDMTDTSIYISVSNVTVDFVRNVVLIILIMHLILRLLRTINKLPTVKHDDTNAESR